MKTLTIAAGIALILSATSTAAYAVTGQEFLEKMTDDERGGYANGAMDAFLKDLVDTGKDDQAVCVSQWYYQGNGPHELVAFIKQYQNLDVVGLLKVLSKRHCK